MYLYIRRGRVELVVAFGKGGREGEKGRGDFGVLREGRQGGNGGKRGEEGRGEEREGTYQQPK